VQIKQQNMGSKLFYKNERINANQNKNTIKPIKIVTNKSHLITSLIVLARI
jgi:hypothetical protein